MKNFKVLLLIVVLISLIAASCNKEEEEPRIPNYTPHDTYYRNMIADENGNNLPQERNGVFVYQIPDNAGTYKFKFSEEAEINASKRFVKLDFLRFVLFCSYEAVWPDSVNIPHPPIFYTQDVEDGKVLVDSVYVNESNSRFFDTDFSKLLVKPSEDEFELTFQENTLPRQRAFFYKFAIPNKITNNDYIFLVIIQDKH